MADDITILDAAEAERVVATDEISGKSYQRVKLIHGADGVNAGDVATANPLPVVQTGTPALPTGSATAARQDTEIGHLATISTAVQLIDNPVATIGGVPLQRVAVFDAMGAQVTSFGGGGGGSGDASAANQDEQTALLTTLADTVTDGAVAVAGIVMVTGPVAVTGTFWQATQPVSAASLPLPSGASTAANQATANAALATLAGAVSGAEVQADVLTLPDITVASSALPTGAATEATLSTLNGKVTAVNTGAVVVTTCALPAGAATESTLSTLSGKIPALGQAVAGSSLPVVLPSAQITTLTPPAAITGFATESTLSTLNGKVPALGQALAAASVPVILPSATITTLTPPAAITGFATQTTLASIDTKVPALGQALAAASVPVVLTASQLSTLTPPGAISGFLTEADFDAKTGSLTETAPASDTASSGLNGRLQRIAQRITSLITALGSPFQAGGSIGNTTFASTVADGANLTLGAKADAKSTATDTTAVSAISVLKQISASVQAPPSQAVTNAGVFVTQPTLQAGTALIGKASVGQDSATVYAGTTAMTPKFASVSAASSGNNTVVAAVASRKIRVLQYRLQADADVTFKFRDNTAGVDLTGAMSSGAKGGGGGAAFCPVGLFETASGNALVLTLGSAIQVSGHIVYVEVA